MRLKQQIHTFYGFTFLPNHFFQNKSGHIQADSKKSITFATANANGTLTERLGIGLQNRVRRFESARYLQTRNRPLVGFLFGGTWKDLVLDFSILNFQFSIYSFVPLHHDL